MDKSWKNLACIVLLSGAMVFAVTKGGFESGTLTPEMLRELPRCPADTNDGDLENSYRLFMKNMNLPYENAFSRKFYMETVRFENGYPFKDTFLPCTEKRHANLNSS